MANPGEKTPAENLDLEVGGRRLRARRLRGTAPSRPGRSTLVFLHEALGSIELWKDFPETLVQATGLDALLYDRQGHGASDPLDQPRKADYLQTEALEVLPRVLEACEVDSAIPIGHSDGGTIALLFAAAHPAMVPCLITEAAHVFVEEITLAGIRRAVNAYRETALREKLARYHGDKTDALFAAWADTWLSPAFAGWNIEHCLPRVTSPTLVIQGADDEYGSLEQVERIAGGVSGPASSLIVPDCGHIPHLQALQQVLPAMASFIARRTNPARL